MLFPGMMTNILPGVYGPTSYPVKKTENGYWIKGYSNEALTGTPKEIAHRILWKLVNEPEGIPRAHYVGPFSMSYFPSIRCGLCMTPDPEPGVDIEALNREVTEEIQQHVTIKVNGNIVTPYIDGRAIHDDYEPHIFTYGHGDATIQTDYHGLRFEIIGDLHVATLELLEYVIHQAEGTARIEGNPKTLTHHVGPLDFEIVDCKLRDVVPYFKEAIPGFDHAPENRPEVFEVIRIIKSALQMKAFW